MWGGGGGTPKIEVPELTEDERELQMVRIAASSSKLVEARRQAGGWVVRVVQESGSLDAQSAQQAAVRFFRELARTGVPVAAASVEVRTNDLKDVWGNPLKEVPVFRVELGGETFQRVNWRGFEPKNLERVADAYWEHDLLKQQAQQGGGGPQGASPEGGGSSGGGQG